MSTKHIPDSGDAERERAERILAAARELLAAWGYKRVTIDEIARRARIGKGTVYLHWKTKQVLFTELLRHEFGEVIGAVAESVEKDVVIALPGRLVREVFRQQSRRPLARAIHTGDTDVLGALAAPASGRSVAQELGFHDLLARLVDVWRSHGLVTRTMPAADQIHTIDAVLAGFITGGVAVPEGEAASPDHRADLLGHTVEAAVEPPVPVDEATVRAAAAEVLALLTAARRALTSGPR
ncbi:TetR/AcrR family transcriptional regulator [Streptomyces poonensis]|uniref:TetR family transcriptional regulator n=1 Tax=Streptomyces poonensis TaxID=68255 RepID=A0A918P8H7_9ACTN|nr:TetR/AcrR family transcriptional regulator [Streptomyces poonensis]GGY90329.1 TetR family transcriptional regulator [Streptomyces poonensis]GLJ87972.1 TetR family transcriptional regulator [Streptomyces poonensis]